MAQSKILFTDGETTEEILSWSQEEINEMSKFHGDHSKAELLEHVLRDVKDFIVEKFRDEK